VTEALVVGVLGLLAIGATTALAERLGLAAPLLLVAFGIVVSLVPGVPTVVVDPEWILVGVLPPLLYASAVAMPAMDFRREFAAISGLSVLLVLLSAGVVGLVLDLVVPGLGLAAGIALGAIVSPTDAVATSIVRRVGVTPRVVTVLEGESLRGDATALVVLRAAVAAAAAAVSVGAVALDFAVSVVVAVVVGFVVGKAALWLRSRVRDATVSTVLSFATPFVASVPVEQLHASGLVAAVVAGLVTGQGALAHLPPRHRIADAQNWRTVAFVLEGGIFLLMGLELTAVVGGLKAEADGAVALGIGLAAAVLAVVLLVRVGYVMPTATSTTRRCARSGSGWSRSRNPSPTRGRRSASASGWR
jgi:monovalent cation/hydrogen antiporter